MYKLILVDDEADVREGVLREIDWAACGFQVADVAENGREALEMAERVAPDVVVTDIRMPFMDGLQLSEEIRRLYPAAKIIILTGYDEFNYARKAIHLQVEEFVLKPFSADELLQALHKVKGRLDAEMAERENLDALQEHYRRSLPLLRELFLGTLVSRKLTEREIRERMAHYGWDLFDQADHRLYCLSVLKLDQAGSGHAANSPVRAGSGGGDGREGADRSAGAAGPAWHAAEDELRRFAVRNVAEEIVGKRQSGLVFQHNEHVVVLTISSDSPNRSDLIRKQTTTMLEEICASVDKYLKFAVTAGIGAPVDRLSMLKYAYDDALAALDYRLLLGSSKVIAIDDVEHRRPMAALRFDELREQALIRCLKVGSDQELASIVDDLFAPLLAADPAPAYRDAQIFLLQIATAMLKAAQDTEEDVNGDLLAGAHPLKELTNFSSLQDAKARVLRVGATLMGRIAADRQTAYRELVEQAKAFTREHYADSDITIARVCAHLHISAGYFSSIFKRETRMTYMAYLLQIRMEAAKELLRTTDLKTFEIAERVGYADPNYFSFSFRKQFGESPKAYRNGARPGGGES